MQMYNAQNSMQNYNWLQPGKILQSAKVAENETWSTAK